MRFSVPGKHPGVLTIAPDGRVSGKELEGVMAVEGERGLLVTPDHHLRETLDAGESFHEIVSPPGGIDARVSCTPAGCTMGPWHRMGWGPDG